MPRGLAVRLLDETGSLSNAGLAEVQTASGYGSVCGLNDGAANAICRRMGFEGGSVSDNTCSEFHGHNICGSRGMPVAMQSLSCKGNEQDLAECSWMIPERDCLEHTRDSVIHCHSSSATWPARDAVRLVDEAGATSAKTDLVSLKCFFQTGGARCVKLVSASGAHLWRVSPWALQPWMSALFHLAKGAGICVEAVFLSCSCSAMVVSPISPVVLKGLAARCSVRLMRMSCCVAWGRGRNPHRAWHHPRLFLLQACCPVCFCQAESGLAEEISV